MFQVDLFSGNFLHISTDVFLQARPAIAFTRVTRPLDHWAREQRFFILHLYDVFNSGDSHPYTFQEVFTADYKRYRFERISRGTGYRDALYRHEATRSLLHGSEIRWNGTGWDLQRLGSRVDLVFPDSYGATRPLQAAIVGLRDSSGKQLRLVRDPEGTLVKVVAEDGQWIELQRQGDHITEVKSSRGDSVRYSYDSLDRLQRVVLPDGTTVSYTYDGSHRITAIHKDGDLILRNEYDDSSRVAEQAFAGGQRYCFDYLLDAVGNPQETMITGPNGRTIRVRLHPRTYETIEFVTANRCK